MFRDLVRQLFGERTDYTMIKGAPLPGERIKNPKERDILYSIFFVLVIVGLTLNIERRLSPTIAKIFLKLPYPKVFAKQSVYPTSSPQVIVKEIEKEDTRVLRLETFLLSKNSPLAPHSEYIIKRSDQWGIDWTLMVAIAGKESGYGKKVAPGSFNPFGLGGRNLMYFKSWEEAIDFEAELLAEDYKKEMISGMQRKYCPSEECASNWTEQILAFSEEILNVKD